jgi:hypothetical protein
MQPLFELTLHPVDLSRHGLNPYGDPLYRVVWADTRKTKVICRGKVHILPRYTHGAEAEAQGHYVLEKWAPPEVIVGMDRQQYEEFLAGVKNAAAEEYPERGEYELSRIFNEDSGPFSKNIDEVALHKQLEFHEWKAKHTSSAERLLEVEAAEDAKEAVQDNEFDALFEVAREESQCLN